VFDEMDQLRASPELFALLAHYADRAGEDRQAWQDRVMEQEGLAPRELSRLHGELIASGWLEQNTGLAGARAGAVTGCYRATPAGRRAVKGRRAEGAAD
jgi:hypothetical protein